ncbi:MAG: ThuA domain-containing protein [Planctomycetota bacterium]|nr:ThuA domain-containing protein [Planctomycetota bacterium]
MIRLRILVLVLGLFALALGCSDSSSSNNAGPQAILGIYSSTRPPGGNPDFRALVFTKTTEFRHDSIGAGVTAIQSLGNSNNFAVDATEDSSLFDTNFLASYSVVIFLNTTGDVLTGSEETSFMSYVANGGGYVGIHSASDTEKNWPFYGQLVGAFFQDHPAIQLASFTTVDQNHPSTTSFPVNFTFTDEIYNFQTDPSGSVNVLVTVDETSYSGGTMGASHPISWFHTNLGGRAWYTNLGHSSATFSDALFLDHLLGGIRYSAGQTP